MICSVPCNAAKKKKTNAKTSFAVISDAKFNKKKLKKNDVFEYSFKISLRDSFDYESEELRYCAFDRKSSHYYVIVHWKSSKKQRVEQIFKWKSTKKVKTIKGEIPIYHGMQTGKWKLDYIEIRDSHPDEEDSSDARLRITNGTKKQQRHNDSDGYAYKNLSFADFKVKGKRKADKKAPTFDKESLTISKSEVGTGEKVTFSVKVEDTSKIQKVECGWEVTSKYSDEPTVWNSFRTMKYNKKTQCYECTVSLGEDDVEVRLCDIYAKDIYGNSQIYTDWCTIECQDDMKSEYHDALSKMVIYKK